MARANLGRTNLAARVPGRQLPHLCISCGVRKPVADFLLRRRARVLGMICIGCRQSEPDVMRKCLTPPLSMLSVHRPEIIKFIQRLMIRRISKGKEVRNKMGEKMSPDDYALKVAKLPERVAAVISKTYAEMQDGAQLADDEALMMIRDLLLELDETLISRNKHKRLVRRKN